MSSVKDVLQSTPGLITATCTGLKGTAVSCKLVYVAIVTWIPHRAYKRGRTSSKKLHSIVRYAEGHEDLQRLNK